MQVNETKNTATAEEAEEKKVKNMCICAVCLLVTPICYVLISYYDAVDDDDDEKCNTKPFSCTFAPLIRVFSSLCLCAARIRNRNEKERGKTFVIIDKQL